MIKNAYFSVFELFTTDAALYANTARKTTDALTFQVSMGLWSKLISVPA